MAKGIGRNGELYSVLCDPAHLIRSARAAARGKKRRPDAARFLLDMEPECFRLAAELADGTWQPGSYHTFMIREPKPRLISAAPFRDRVVHHALVSVLEPHFERRFVAHSYACRKGKGTHRALERAADLSRKRKFVLKGDISKFFPSIDHEILKGEVWRVIADERLLGVLERVIDGSNPQEPALAWFEGDDLFTPAARRRGIPIGNLTSQFLANVLMDRFDHVVMDREGYGEYVRYCDDFLVFADTRAELWALRERIARHLAAMRLVLHERKGGVHRTSSTIPFLGFTVARGVQRLQRAGVVRGEAATARFGRRVRGGRDRWREAACAGRIVAGACDARVERAVRGSGDSRGRLWGCARAGGLMRYAQGGLDPKTTNRVLRGGSWGNNTNNVRSSNRNNNTPDNTNNNIGFRVASTRDQQVSM